MSWLKSGPASGPCLLYPSSYRHPFALPALPGFFARMGGSDFRQPPLSSSLLTLVRECVSATPTGGSPWLLRNLYVRLDTAWDPGVASVLALTHRELWPASPLIPSALPNAVFSGLYTFKVSTTCYLCTSPPLLPTHQSVCYQTDCKAEFQARG